MIFVGDGVILVFVAASAFQREAKEGRGKCVVSVSHVFDTEFFRYAAALDLLGMQSIKCCGQDLLLAGFGQQISGQLFGDELVVGFVII